jgi:hypothetical protein
MQKKNYPFPKISPRPDTIQATQNNGSGYFAQKKILTPVFA